MTIARSVATALQILIVLTGIAVAAFLLWEPWVEGVNANATTLYEIYFDDPFLAYAYTSSLLLFAALYQAFMVLGYAKENRLFSRASVRALQLIQYFTTTLAALVVAAVLYIIVVISRVEEDIAGGVAMGLFTICILGSMAIAALVLKRFIEKRSYA
jgi:hypothetical protein